MKKILLSMKDVSLQKDACEKPILNSVSMDIYEQDFIFLLGANGSGKSSLIKVIAGLENLVSGCVAIQGQSMHAMSMKDRSKLISTLMQDVTGSTFSKLTVLENCWISLSKGESLLSVKRPNLKILKRYLENFNPNLAKKLYNPVYSLSGGERQTLALAMCLFKVPQLLLLDEHTSALDPLIVRQLMDITVQISSRDKMAVLAVSHDIKSALNHGNRLIFMRKGQIVLDVRDKEKQVLKEEDVIRWYQSEECLL